ncbi:substrate-binding periplasmic protein [Desulfonema magnum]|uniref:Extracellular solute-binding protein N-terminal domain-containing protein n=1 Tax=Desulfonema magnum TaxID=45655 RepID=A0A975BT39_9BACT|nr:transporter substrate-binding domain-containing protein [Desulfonema magnum]QTA90903.1 Extracellular solute-binding protein N-terminal domain-containing protein [Desulfonema magnum]
MKNLKVRKTAVVVFFLSFLISVPCFPEEMTPEKSEHPDVIRIALEEYPPLQSPTLKYFGSDCRILTESFESVGIKVIYGWFPWKRCLYYVKNGEWDAAANGSSTPEREKFFWFSEPVSISKTVFFHRKDYSFDWNVLDDLKGHRIGVILGHVYGEAFENIRDELTIDVAGIVPHNNLKKLYAKRIDITPVDLTTCVFMMKTDSKLQKIADSITWHPKPIQSAEWCLMFSKKVEKNKHMLKLFNRGLKILKDDGRCDRYHEEALNGEYGTK